VNEDEPIVMRSQVAMLVLVMKFFDFGGNNFDAFFRWKGVGALG
jgi:hypothetical protein